jgi:D-alanine-D-alanine ligase
VRIALTHNLRRNDTEQEAELDSPETIDALALAMRAHGHEVVPVEVTCSLAEASVRLLSARPDLVFHFAAGLRGKMREAVYPALYEDLGLPYAGSDGWTLCVSLDKSLAKMLVARAGVPVARSVLATSPDAPGAAELAPCILKPCYQSSSMGITDASVVMEPERVRPALEAALAAWPDGILVEEYIPGTDVTVPYIAGLGTEILAPCSYDVAPGRESRYRLYDYRLKHHDHDAVTPRCPAAVPEETAERIRGFARIAVRELRLVDYARVDFRVHDDGRIFFIEANAMPALESSSSLFVASARHGYSFVDAIGHVIERAARRLGLQAPGAPARPTGAASPSFSASPRASASDDAGRKTASPGGLDRAKALPETPKETAPAGPRGGKVRVDG